MELQTGGLPAVLAGRYRLGPVLGRGGMADVYAAVDDRSGDAVAVKVFRDRGLVDPGGAGEVATLRRLRHPNLVELLDAGSDGEHDFYVMAVVDGPTLAQECDAAARDAAWTARVGADLAAALAYVHDQGVIHRDVKPANVLLGPGERVRLADFGIARFVDATRVTRSGLVVGTAGYLAPEQVTGGRVGPAVDVYALGLVLLECLTGRREYPGPALEAALARLHRPPQLPADLASGWCVLLRAMFTAEPGARPTAGQVAQALRVLTSRPQAGAAVLDLLPPQAGTAPARVSAAPAPAAVLPEQTRHSLLAGRRWRVSLVLSAAVLAAAGLAVTASSLAGDPRTTAETATAMPGGGAVAQTTTSEDVLPPPPPPSAALDVGEGEMVAQKAAGPAPLVTPAPGDSDGGTADRQADSAGGTGAGATKAERSASVSRAAPSAEQRSRGGAPASTAASGAGAGRLPGRDQAAGAGRSPSAGGNARGSRPAPQAPVDTGSEQDTDRPAKNTDHPKQGTDRPAKNTDRPKQGTDRPAKNTDRPEQGKGGKEKG